MHPHTKLTVSLLVSLALWAPSLLACISGELDVLVAGVHYAATFAFIRLALGGLDHLYRSYRAAVTHNRAADDDVAEGDDLATAA